MNRNSWFIVGLVAIMLTVSFGLAPAATQADGPVKKDVSIQTLRSPSRTTEYIWLQAYWAEPQPDGSLATRIRAKADRTRNMGYILSRPKGWLPDIAEVTNEWLEVPFPAGDNPDAPYDLVVWSQELEVRASLNWQGGHFGECQSTAYTGLAVYRVRGWYHVDAVIRQETGRLLYATTDFGLTWDEVPSGKTWNKPVPPSGRIDFFLTKSADNYALFCGGASWSTK